MRRRNIGLAGALAALVALAAALVLLLAPERDGGRPRRTEDGTVAPAPDAALRPAERAAAVAVDPALARRDSPVAGEPDDDAEEPLRARIDGRVVDLEDRPIAGAEVRLSDDALVAASGADGAFDASLELGADAPVRHHGAISRLELLICAPGHRSATLHVGLGADDVVHLGTVHLGAGGDAAGRVVDERGAPLVGARVGWRVAAAWPEDEETARLDGVGRRSEAEETPEARTDAEGRFRLRGVPDDEIFLVADEGHRLCAWSDVFTLPAGETVERTLVLAPDPRNETMRGRVLDPAGHAVPRARVGLVMRFSFSASVVRSAGETDAAGRFALERVVGEGETAPPELVAWDPEERWSPSEIVAAGGGELELVLTSARHVEIRATSADGTAIGWGHVRLRSTGLDPGRPSGALLPLGREGRVRILCPSVPFELEAFAPGWRTTKVGPFGHATASDPLVIVLAPGDAVRGRVTAGGRPLSGARVGVSTTRDPAKLTRSLTLAPSTQPFTLFGVARGDPGDATTGRDGRFTVTLHSDGWHSVAVAADGYPTSFFGPFEWTRGPGFAEVELALEPAGAIEGRVLVPPGRAAAGRLVGVSSGWNVAWTAAADADGRFRIEGLAPGRYQVRPCVPPATARETVHPRPAEAGEPPPELAWDCAVSAGETTRFDLDLRDEEDFVLAGRLAFDGAPSLWTAVLRPREPERAFQLAEAPLAADGTFELALSRGGALVLELRSPSRGFRQELDLAPGRTDWIAELRRATLEVRGAPPPAADGREQRATFRWRGAGDLVFHQSLSGTDDPEGYAVPVPAGRGELVLELEDDGAPSRTRALELEPGSRTVLDLSQPR